jgi:Tfp pilus assembly protein PilN
MIQFNLLPDVKLTYIKTQRLKHTITIFASIGAATLLVIFVITYLITDVVQKNHIKSLNTQITTLTSQLQKTPNLKTVLTVQDAVNALPGLNASKPVTTRLSGYISSVTPAKATISSLTVNFTDNSIDITGQADSLATVNLFVDTLKQSTYQTATNGPTVNVFSDVILSSFSFTSSSGATYSITTDFAPAIFSQANNNITLSVPTTTSSHNGSSGVLFQTQTNTSTGN